MFEEGMQCKASPLWTLDKVNIFFGKTFLWPHPTRQKYRKMSQKNMTFRLQQCNPLLKEDDATRFVCFTLQRILSLWSDQQEMELLLFFHLLSCWNWFLLCITTHCDPMVITRWTDISGAQVHVNL